MAIVTQTAKVVPAPAAADAEGRPASSWRALFALVPLALAGTSLLIGSAPTAQEIVRAVLVLLWAISGAILSVRRPHSRSGPLVLLGATIGSVGALCGALDADRSFDGAAELLIDLGIRLSATLLPA